MTRIAELRPGASKAELLSASSVSALRKVAAEGIEIAALLSQISEPDETQEIPLNQSLKALSGVLIDCFDSVLSFASNREQLEDLEP